MPWLRSMQWISQAETTAAASVAWPIAIDLTGDEILETVKTRDPVSVHGDDTVEVGWLGGMVEGCPQGIVPGAAGILRW